MKEGVKHDIYIKLKSYKFDILRQLKMTKILNSMENKLQFLTEKVRFKFIATYPTSKLLNHKLANISNSSKDCKMSADM